MRPAATKNLRLLAFSFAAALLCASALASTQVLPQEAARILRRHGISPDQAGIFIAWQTGEPIVMHNLDRPFNPASSIKMVTSMAALDLLGPGHTWETSLKVAAPVVNGDLRGDLYVKGEGDPMLTVERLQHLVFGLWRRGVRRVSGDIVVDDTAFEVPRHDPSAFDGRGTRAYNAGPGASVVNYGVSKVVIHVTNGKVDAFLEPPSTTFELVNQLKLRKGICTGNWRSRIRERLSRLEDGTARLVISGSYPSGCGEQGFHLLGLADPSVHLAGAVGSIFEEMGGEVIGDWRKDRAPQMAKSVVGIESHTLAEVIRGMNKYSNNFMARNVFLSIGAGGDKRGVSLDESRKALAEWFAGMGVDTTGLYVDNGSGLSRDTRITPRQFGAIAMEFVTRPYKHELIASLSLLGRDGTSRRWNSNKKSAGNAHIKTGTLSNARSTVGYVHNPAGDIVFIVMVETRGTAAARRAIQEMLDWSYRIPGAETT